MGCLSRYSRVVLFCTEMVASRSQTLFSCRALLIRDNSDKRLREKGLVLFIGLTETKVTDWVEGVVMFESTRFEL